MKRIIFVLILILPIFLQAQLTEGNVTYEEKVHLNIKAPPGMEGMFPEFQTLNMVLLFNEKASVYDLKKGEEMNKTMTSENEGAQIQINIQRPENIVFRDTETQNIVELQEFFGRKFLINGDKKIAWKIKTEQKKILGYLCQRAVFVDSTKNLEAWFCPQIPASTGPAGYGGLPGLILKLSAEDGEHIYVATKIDELGADDTIEAPSEGKKISREKFLKIQAEKMKEMQEEHGGKGGIIIQRN